MPAKDQNPLYGRRLLLSILDQESQSMPNRTFAAIAESTDISDGFGDVSVATIAIAANYLAYRLQSVFGTTLEHDFETLTYIGASDLRYSIFFYAGVKCGYKVAMNHHGALPKLIQLTEGPVSFATEYFVDESFIDGADQILEVGLLSRGSTPDRYYTSFEAKLSLLVFARP